MIFIINTSCHSLHHLTCSQQGFIAQSVEHRTGIAEFRIFFCAYFAGQVRSGQVKSGHVKSGHVMSGQGRAGQVKSGQGGVECRVLVVSEEPSGHRVRFPFVAEGFYLTCTKPAIRMTTGLINSNVSKTNQKTDHLCRTQRHFSIPALLHSED